jgi:hypothetical protein
LAVLARAVVLQYRLATSNGRDGVQTAGLASSDYFVKTTCN